MKTKEFLYSLSDRLRFYALSALQVFLGITILPAIAVVVAILWIEDIKDE